MFRKIMNRPPRHGGRQLEKRRARASGRRLNELIVFVSFSEISYLQLTFLDLSGNRITVLPVELRFMTTVVHLNLEENPLSCPPANVSKERSLTTGNAHTKIAIDSSPPQKFFFGEN